MVPPAWLERRAFLWLVFYLVILIAWVLLYSLARSLDGGAVFGALGTFFSPLSHTQPINQWSGLNVIAMWALMAAGMMLPTLIPVVQSYVDLSARLAPFKAALARGSFIGAYLAIWIAFALIAGWAQLRMAGLGWIDAGGTAVRPSLTIALLLLAGLYQFSALKQACLSACQAPFQFFLAHWRDGVGGAARMGLHHGVICLGCCWALMTLAFVGGTMNLIWMGVMTALMALEKIPAIGKRLSPLLGGLLICLALAYAAAWAWQTLN